MNEHGVIVGVSRGNESRPVSWVDEIVEDLSPGLEPFFSGDATDISDAGDVVGRYRAEQFSPDLAFHIDLRTGETVVIGTIPDGDRTDAAAVNNRGQVLVIGRDLKSGERRTFVWRAGEMTDLGLPPGHVLTRGLDLNDRGLVVGGSSGEDGVYHAFVWHRGSFFDLNDLVAADGLRLESALAISNNGIIVGGARRDDNAPLGIRLTPVGAPAGDVTGDCAVNFTDLLVLLSEWGPCEFCIADLNEDQTVDLNDLRILLASWGQ
jgi:probable HAF family extracellular repeat protein